MVTFEGTSVSELKEAFQDAVEDYFSLCSELGKNPHKSYKGSFNIRIKPELHKMAQQIATMEGISLNQLIQEAIAHEVAQKKEKLKITI